MKSFIQRWAPPPEAVLNGPVNWIPFAGLRMRLYKIFGVRFADVRSGVIMRRTEVFKPSKLYLGRGSIIGRHCLVDARGGLEIGDNVNISSYSRFMTAKHVIDDPGFPAEFSPIVVGDHVWIALGATILGGVTIGEGAVVAAGAVVTKDVAPFAVVAGIPATKIRDRSRELDYEQHYRPNWI